MSVNASNIRKFPFTPKVYPIVFWVILITLQLHCNAIDNVRIDTIDTIDTIDRIYYIDQYKDYQFDRSGGLTL